MNPQPASFERVVAFAAVASPALMFAALACADKLGEERLGNADDRTAWVALLSWAANIALLASGHDPMFYVGSSLAYVVFFHAGAFDWARIGVVYAAFSVLAYAASYSALRSVLVPYFVAFAFFRALSPTATDAALRFVPERASDLGIVALVARELERILLGAMCVRHSWTEGAVDPIVAGLTALAVFARHFDTFLHKPPRSKAE